MRWGVLTIAVAGLLSVASVQAEDKTEEANQPQASLPWIQVSDDKTHFVEAETGKRFVVWGANYDRDDSGRLLEDYWADEWETVQSDFREMKELGLNVVRVHLQLGKFMDSADKPNKENLERLRRLVKLAEETGLYLDVTGLGCYHKRDVPAWYDELDEDARWTVQARFWEAVAGVCRDSPAIFCYDLMNEPVVGNKVEKGNWLGPDLQGKHYVQRISLQQGDRTPQQVAQQWIERLTDAIRTVDPRRLITVGVIPWALEFKGAKPLFHDPKVGEKLDFVAVHFYPKKGEIDRAIEALKVYDVGKPLVVEEMFPMHCSIEEMDDFITRSARHADGWVSFYWGKTREEYAKQGDLLGAIMDKWLEFYRGKGAEMKVK